MPYDPRDDYYSEFEKDYIKEDYANVFPNSNYEYLVNSKISMLPFNLLGQNREKTLINLAGPEYNYKRFSFPDNQPHIRLDLSPNNNKKHICVNAPIRSPKDLFELMLLINAIDRERDLKKDILFIPYLMCARYDRVMIPGDPLPLEVIANIINGMNFRKVYVLDVHSDVALSLINNSHSVGSDLMVEDFVKRVYIDRLQSNSTLIVPDSGAAKRNQNIKKLFNDTLVCHKTRNLENGNIELVVPGNYMLLHNECIVIDDLCDGGRTFTAIAEQIQRKNSLGLIVTHGIFSKGTKEILDKYDYIVTTDSYFKPELESKIHQKYIYTYNSLNLLLEGAKNDL